MAIASINGESRSIQGTAHEADLAGAGRSESRPAAAALTSGVRSQAPSPVARPPGWGSSAPVPFYKPMPAAGAFALRAEAFAPALRGYAPSSRAPRVTAAPSSAAGATSAKAKSTASPKSSTSKGTKAASTKSSTPRELAFLDDKNMSIEDKLFRFMMLMTKKNDQELVDAMKEYETKKAVQSKSSGSSGKTSGPAPSSGGGGLFGFLGDALGGIGKTIVGGAESLVKDLGGPVLAGVVTAAGMPFLAPVALQIGGNLGEGLIEGVASTVGLGKSSPSHASGSVEKSRGSSSGTQAAGSSSEKASAAGGPEKFDEKLAMFNLQRMVEKQNAMFSALSNAMKSIHDSEMTAVQNIR